MKIGKLEIQGNTILAPLAGITSQPFRTLVKRCGCALVCSEMVSAKGLFYNSDKTARLLETHPDEHPVSIQIFGSEPDIMAMAARNIQQRGDADLIDINMGCSVRKVVKTGAGVALMQNPDNAEAVIKAVRGATSLPFTIKIRAGWDNSGRQAVDIAGRAEKCGVDAVAIHPRTASQGFRGKADWALIKQLKEILSVPVIGNGDIVTPNDGIRMMEETGCDAVMVGRAAMSNPFILADIDDMIAGRNCKERSIDEIFDAMRTLLMESVDYFGEETACKMMRSRLVWFVKGWPECSKFRQALTRISKAYEALELMESYRSIL
ncbi:tRNA-dihydrouridine synthase [Desulfamplus magnetovallimortis]|uniref:tRNA-dihydrouridine synthase n=1 Tax=Desulfamplus magnetovallimortis TaxID=1246637 RepID=A0A1W1H9E1_9BACT|nr:tRNA dihydrouridine synthase DusB [Desulfamplus magnetovallimortis]SLM29056.1 tRNA-dihydrouridine synthase [Desulfamplus magnetovallimortis]